MTEEVYDVSIIGGGIVGCATFFKLTQEGYSCVMCEADNDLMAGASSGNRSDK